MGLGFSRGRGGAGGAEIIDPEGAKGGDVFVWDSAKQRVVPQNALPFSPGYIEEWEYADGAIYANDTLVQYSTQVIGDPDLSMYDPATGILTIPSYFSGSVRITIAFKGRRYFDAESRVRCFGPGGLVFQTPSINPARENMWVQGNSGLLDVSGGEKFYAKTYFTTGSSSNNLQRGWIRLEIL